MKKLICLLLALTLLVSAAFALADEEAKEPKYPVKGKGDMPNIAFGSPAVLALETFTLFWRPSYSFIPEDRKMDTVTLSDGSEITVMTMPAAPGDEYRVPMTATFYFDNGNLAAAVQEVAVPEGMDPSILIESFRRSMEGDPVPLQLDKTGTAAEMLGETARLAEGQDAWYYTYVDDAVSLDAIVTVNVTGSSVFFAEFPAPASEEKKAEPADGAQKPEDMEGSSDLSAEEQKMVTSYAEFLEQQKAGMIRLYIDFLLRQHK